MRPQAPSRSGPLASPRGRLGEYRILRKIADGAHATVKRQYYFSHGPTPIERLLHRSRCPYLDRDQGCPQIPGQKAVSVLVSYPRARSQAEPLIECGGLANDFCNDRCRAVNIRINELDMRSRVSREIQYLRLLSHPHIIKLWVHLGATRYGILVLTRFPQLRGDRYSALCCYGDGGEVFLPLNCYVNNTHQSIQYAEGELFYLISQHGRVSEAEARSYFQQIMYV